MSSLMHKLERDALQRQCKKEVDELHQLFVAWFQGVRPKEELEQELKQRLQYSFSHVAPNGQFLLGRKVLIKHLEDKYACYKERTFQIDIYNVQLLWSDEAGRCLCTYEEWQSWQQADNEGKESLVQFGRLSTCLLEKAEGRMTWVHVHETWLESEAPPQAKSPPPAAMDDETMMTGPVEAHKIKRNKKEIPQRRPTDLPQHEDNVDVQAHLVVLMSSQIMSHDQVLHQEKAFTILKARSIRYVEIDGADFKQHDRRNELFDESGILGKYPQFFVEKNGKTTFWGDWKKLEEANDAGTLKKDLQEAFDTNNSDKDVPVTTDDASAKEGDDQDRGLAASAAVAAVAAAASKGVDNESTDEQETDISSRNIEAKTPATEAQDTQDDGDILQLEPDDEEDADEPDERDPYEGMNPDERAFMYASQGILEFEPEEQDEEENNPQMPKLKPVEEDFPSEEDWQGQSPIPQDASAKRHLSPKLIKYAKPLKWENALVGISVAGFDIGTSQGPMGDETWFKETGESLEELAQSRSIPRPRRKICLPEMVFPTAHVALEGHGFWLSWDAVDALEEWARCHHEIAIHSRISHNGVSVMRAKDAKLWDQKRKHGQSVQGGVSSVFHYDWTFSTPFCGKVEGGTWHDLDESGMRLSLLTDQSAPILFYDEIILYEDDLHDNGQVQFAVKLRVMPSCAYILARQWLRVDNVMVRVRETRVLVDFMGLSPQIYRDISWRECMWSELAAHKLPTDVRSWCCEGKETPAWNELLKALPEYGLPKGLPKYSVLQRPVDFNASTTVFSSEDM